MTEKKDFIKELELQADELFAHARFDLEQELSNAREHKRAEGESVFSWISRVEEEVQTDTSGADNVVQIDFSRYHVECEFIRLAASTSDTREIPDIELESECGNFNLVFKVTEEDVSVKISLLGFPEESLFDATFALLDADGNLLGEPFTFSEEADVEVSLGSVDALDGKLDKIALVRVQE